MLCKHERFEARVAINRMIDTGRFMADVTVKCADCHEPFHFIGVDMGLSMLTPRVSVDGLELRAPIAPGISPALGKLQ